jgi:phosphate-selective porin OprO/OprP
MKNHNLKLNYWILAAVLGVPMAQLARADEAADIAALKAQVDALEQKIRILEQQHAVEKTNTAVYEKSLPTITIGANGFAFGDANTNFAVAIHGTLQLDTRTFGNNDKIPGSSGLLLRRARPILTGTIFHDFDFNFTPDFGNGTPGSASAASTPTIYDAFINYRYSSALQFQAGKFKTPVGLEQLQSDNNLSFNERSLVTDLVPNRDVGFELHGDVDGGVLSYAAGVFSGVGDARNTSNYSFQNNREFDGRLFALPFKDFGAAAVKNIGFGVGGGWGVSSITNTLGLPNTTGGSLPGFTTDGQEQFFAYNPTSGSVVAGQTHWRLSPQGTYYYGPFSLLGEYAISDQDIATAGVKAQHSADLQNTAWEISSGWVLTGEDASFNGVIPKHPFNPREGDWGAWQVVARYAELNVDKAAFPYFSNPATSASGAQSWSVGLNWFLNQNIRADASFSHTTFDGGGTAAATGAPGSVSSHPEDVFFTRLQLAF